MPVNLEKWMEEKRLNELDMDLARYKKEMEERYPQSLWESARKRAQALQREHSFDFLKHIGMLIIAEVIILVAFDGFAAGALATIAFFIYVFVFKEHSKSESDWFRLQDPRSDDDIETGLALERRQNNPDMNRENWLARNKSGDDDVQEVEEQKESDSEKQDFFIHCPRPIEEYSGGPAIIFTVVKDKNWPLDENDYHIICVKLEEITSDNQRIVIWDEEYGGGFLSWLRDEACSIGYEKNLPVYGQDLICDLTSNSNE